MSLKNIKKLIQSNNDNLPWKSEPSRPENIPNKDNIPWESVQLSQKGNPILSLLTKIVLQNYRNLIISNYGRRPVYRLKYYMYISLKGVKE